MEMPVPVGMDDTEKFTLMDAIRGAARPFSLVEPDPDYMALQVVQWATGKMYKWQTLYDSTRYEYDLMTNVDFTETYKEKVDEAGKQSGSSKDEGQSKTVGDSETEGKTQKEASESSNSEDTRHKAGLKDTDKTASKDTDGTEKIKSSGNSDSTTTVNSDSEASDAYQGLNSTIHRPVSKTDTDSSSTSVMNSTTGQTDDKTFATDESAKENVIEDYSDDESGTAASSGKSEENTTSTGHSKNEVDTETSLDSVTSGEHEKQTIREYEHRTVGNRSLRSQPVFIQEERDIADLDMYAVIAWDFVERFCIMVY